MGIFPKQCGTALRAVSVRFAGFVGNSIGLFSGGADAAERRSTLRSLGIFPKQCGTALRAVSVRFAGFFGNSIGLFSGGADAAERRSTLRRFDLRFLNSYLFS